jgi:hypothetical protein
VPAKVVPGDRAAEKAAAAAAAPAAATAVADDAAPAAVVAVAPLVSAVSEGGNEATPLVTASV